MTRTLLAPGYIYSAAKDSEHLPFFERQYLKFVNRYDDDVAKTPDRKEIAKKIGYAFFHNLKHQWETNCKIDGDFPIETLGDKGFDWKFLRNSLSKDSVIYGFGIGTNISFEEQLAEETGAKVHCFDPTPQAAEYAIPIAKKNGQIVFHPIGVYSIDGIVRFYKPTEPGLGSLSATNLTYSDVSINAPVKRLSTIMKMMKHEHIDLLKIDIEGAEHGVIEDMLFNDIQPDQVCVEFDMPVPPWTIEETIRKLLLSGYQLIDIWGLNCLFVHDRLLKKM